jgi:hypothetical protein
VFLNAFVKLGPTTKYRFFSWVYRMTVNESLNVLKGRKRTVTLEAEPSVPAPGATADRTAEVQDLVGRALMRLKHDDRAVVVLKHFASFSYEEIAEVLEIPVRTVKSPVYGAGPAAAGAGRPDRSHQNRDRIELIHQEIDGENTADERRLSLLEEDAEPGGSRAARVAGSSTWRGARTAPHLRRAILDALPQPALAMTESKWMTPREVFRWSLLHLKLGAERLEETIMTKKAMLIGGAVVATVIVIAGIVTGFPPGSREPGTIGGVERRGIRDRHDRSRRDHREPGSAFPGTVRSCAWSRATCSGTRWR